MAEISNAQSRWTPAMSVCEFTIGTLRKGFKISAMKHHTEGRSRSFLKTTEISVYYSSVAHERWLVALVQISLVCLGRQMKSSCANCLAKTSPLTRTAVPRNPSGLFIALRVNVHLCWEYTWTYWQKMGRNAFFKFCSVLNSPSRIKCFLISILNLLTLVS